MSAAEGQALALELGMAWAEVSNLTGSGGAHSPPVTVDHLTNVSDLLIDLIAAHTTHSHTTHPTTTITHHHTTPSERGV